MLCRHARRVCKAVIMRQYSYSSLQLLHSGSMNLPTTITIPFSTFFFQPQSVPHIPFLTDGSKCSRIRSFAESGNELVLSSFFSFFSSPSARNGQPLLQRKPRESRAVRRVGNIQAVRFRSSYHTRCPAVSVYRGVGISQYSIYPVLARMGTGNVGFGNVRTPRNSDIECTAGVA